MIRKTREEAGLVVVSESVKEYGYVHRIQRSDKDAAECFVQDNFYYLCRAEDVTVPQKLDDYEAQESFRLEYAEPLAAISGNHRAKNSPCDPLMVEREARVLERPSAEGLL